MGHMAGEGQAILLQGCVGQFRRDSTESVLDFMACGGEDLCVLESSHDGGADCSVHWFEVSANAMVLRSRASPRPMRICTFVLWPPDSCGAGVAVGP